MRIFPDYNKPGNGVSKQDAEPKDFELFGLLIKNHYAVLLLLNLFFILSTVLVVPYGAALKGLNRATISMVRLQPEKPIKVFWQGFKDEFVKTALFGLVVLAVLFVLGFSLYSYWGTGRTGLIGLSLVLLLFVLCLAMYSFKMLAVLDLPIGSVVKNAVLLTLASPKTLLLCLAFVIVPSALLARFIAIGGALFLLFWFAFISLITSVITWPLIKKHLIKPAAETSPTPQP